MGSYLDKRRRWTVLGKMVLFLAVVLSYCQRPPEGKRIGSSYQELSKAEVWKVPSRSQAQIIGLRPGDLIIAYNDEVIKNFGDYLAAEKHLVGTREAVKLTVLRDEQEINLETKPVPLSFIPRTKMYSASLAKALDDILQHFGQQGFYDWLAAMTGESFALTLLDQDCQSWGGDGLADNYLTNVGKFTGLSFRTIYQSSAGDTEEQYRARAALAQGLAENKFVLVYGGWEKVSGNGWGIVVRFDSKDSVFYGYAIEDGEEQALKRGLVRAYEVKFRGKVNIELPILVTTVLEQALEMGLAASDSGWHSGLEAYDVILKQLERFPLCPEGVDVSNLCFYNMVWRLISKKESANRFLYEMREVLPEGAEMFEEVIGRNRAIIGRLEGVAAAGVSFNSLDEQRKVAKVIYEIQQIENDILGIYEEIIGEL